MTVELPVLRVPTAAIPAHVQSHASGGRDQWTAPLAEAPADPERELWRVLDEVLDPEIPIGLVDLGLIYGVRMEGDVAHVRLTYTATGCPCMEFIREDITDRLTREPWIRAVELDEVWEPPWTRDRISERGRKKLRSLGVV
ncbi:MAG: metal-sulfur cluster assembly factor [Gemmatimonadota bacterium]